jgi:hypothetical protein
MRAVAKRMRAEFEASEAIQHAGTKGSWREATVCDFLRAYLPSQIRVGHGGEIISTSGEVSNECDVILSDRSTPPFLGTDIGTVVPNECVYGVIEVKTSLTKRQLIDACEKIRRAKRMPKTAYRPNAVRPRYQQNGRDYGYFPTVGMIFAFGGPSLRSVADNVRTWTAGKPPEEWPDSVWILGKGYIAWWNTTLGLVDMSPSAQSQIMLVEAEPELDILLPFALNMNIMFGHASMAPLNLIEYANGIELGHNMRVWTEDPN